MRNGIFDLAGPDAPDPTPPTGPRVYSPGFRPWVSGMQMHLPNDTGWSGLGAGDTLASKALPGWVIGLGVGVGVLAIGALAIWPLMGYYVGKKLGTKWGWFWGLGGPIGLAGMQGYRQYKGRAAPESYKPNRRNRKRHSRRRRAC